MQTLKISLLLVAAMLLMPQQGLAQGQNGQLSLVTNPQVMVYVDRQRLGMTPIINQTLSPGEHTMSLLLILPNGNRLRADYRVMIEAGRETFASLNLVDDAPSEGEVRTIAPPPVKAPPPRRQPPQPVKNNPPQQNNPGNLPVQTHTGPAKTQGPNAQGSWATNPGRPPQGPVAVNPPQKQPPRPQQPPPPPQPSFGLSRDLVREGLEAMRPAVERCMAGRAGVVQVRMVIQPDGGVDSVEAQGAYRGTNAGTCIEQALPEEAAFPIYEGDPIPVVYPYRINMR